MGDTTVHVWGGGGEGVEITYSSYKINEVYKAPRNPFQNEGNSIACFSQFYLNHSILQIATCVQ